MSFLEEYLEQSYSGSESLQQSRDDDWLDRYQDFHIDEN